jgi:hypothetical protein
MWHGIPFLTSQRIPLCDVTEDSLCLSLVVWSHTVYFSTKGFPYFWWRDVTHIFPYIASSVTRRWWLRIFSLGDSLSLMTSLRDFNRHESGFAPRIPLVLIMWDHKCNLMKWGDSPPFWSSFHTFASPSTWRELWLCTNASTVDKTKKIMLQIKFWTSVVSVWHFIKVRWLSVKVFFKEKTLFLFQVCSVTIQTNEKVATVIGSNYCFFFFWTSFVRFCLLPKRDNKWLLGPLQTLS